ncbi:claspin [Pelodytes ibericus]
MIKVRKTKITTKHEHHRSVKPESFLLEQHFKISQRSPNKLWLKDTECGKSRLLPISRAGILRRQLGGLAGAVIYRGAMAAELGVQGCLGSEELIPEVKHLESDSDSGQGSCEMASPSELNNRMGCLDDDSDEEILISKKSKNKKLLVESDSDEEVERETVTVQDEVNDDSEKENVSGLAAKPSRIRSAMLDSDDSDKEEGSENFIKPLSECTIPVNKHKKGHKYSKGGKSQEKTAKGKSKRRSEKAEKKMASLRKQKKEKQKSQMQTDEEQTPLNDSGCLLADKDLYENDSGSAEEEESLDAIRTNIKNKLKSQSSADYEGSDPEQEFEDRLDRDKRKERKAALKSKEAMKQLHSETQRLLRESSVSLPYHLPEPKTIHDFFKRRPRPACQGNAMQLIKSAKYQPCNVEERMDIGLANGLETQKCESASISESEAEPGPLQDPQDLDTIEQEVVNKGSTGEECEPLSATDCPETPLNPLPCIERLDQADSYQHSIDSEVNVVMKIDKEILNAQSDNGICDLGHLEKSSPAAPPMQHATKLSKLEKLRAMGVDLSLKPRLCPDYGSFVNLDEPKQNKELEALKQRFLKHTLHKVIPVSEKKVNLTVVRKETTAEGKEELKADIVSVTVPAENLEEQIHGKPGEKLQVLKAKLQEAMKVRRNEERQKRQALFNLDNEDGFHDDEEEAEMTEESEEEDDTETAEYLLGVEEQDDGNEDTAKHESEKDSPNAIHVRRPIATESTLMLFKYHSTKLGDSLPDKLDQDDVECKPDGKLVSEEEDLLLVKESSHNSSFELIGSMIPSYQPFHKNARGTLHSISAGFRSPSPMHFKTSFLSSASKSSGKMSEPSLPVEDSQDLYNASPEAKASYLSAGADSQFQFSLEDDTQSQLLDADGFLNVGRHRSSAKHRLVLDTMDENAMDANMGELLDLCSGQFKDSSQADEKLTKEDAMDELLGLCSGKFVSQVDTSTQNGSPSAKLHKNSPKKDLMSEAVALCSGSFPVDREENEEEEEEEFGDFQLLPCDESDSGEEEESDCEQSEEEKEGSDEDDEEELLRQQQRKRKKLRLKDFMENEAELSGSEVDSGDEDEGEEDDEYEEEAIDEDLPSDEELQDQVNKIHMKVTMDEDQRRLRLYQERYLADGDLHSDGPGRTRKYRWKIFDDASQLDMFRRDSELEEQDMENEELDETEVKWRKQRIEREQWLREQSENKHADQEEEEEDIGEGSQFMKLAKKVTAKALKKLGETDTSEVKKPVSRNPFEVIRPFSNPKMQTGSLLNKPKEVLQKLAAMSDLNPNATRNSRNFVFQTLSPGKKETSLEKPKSKIRKNIALATPSPKRFKLDNPTIAKNKSRSIFPFLEN